MMTMLAALSRSTNIRLINRRFARPLPYALLEPSGKKETTSIA
jgi:hypothetical protein